MNGFKYNINIRDVSLTKTINIVEVAIPDLNFIINHAGINYLSKENIGKRLFEAMYKEEVSIPTFLIKYLKKLLPLKKKEIEIMDKLKGIYFE